MISVITSGTFPRIWRIRITQIHCGSISKADSGCLQYYTSISGRVKSFNFNTVSGRQLSNQDYSICIRTERNFCGIQYNACPDLGSFPIRIRIHVFAFHNLMASEFSFQMNSLFAENNRSRSFTISGNSNNAVGSMVGSGTRVTENSCIQDWLLIGCMRSADRIPPLSACEDRVCGGTFNAEVGLTQKIIQCK